MALVHFVFAATAPRDNLALGSQHLDRILAQISLERSGLVVAHSAATDPWRHIRSARAGSQHVLPNGLAPASQVLLLGGACPSAARALESARVASTPVLSFVLASPPRSDWTARLRVTVVTRPIAVARIVSTCSL